MRKEKDKDNYQPSRKLKLLIFGAIAFGVAVHEIKCILFGVEDD